MIYHFDEQHDTEEHRARQVGASAPTPFQQQSTIEGAAHADAEIGRQVERVRWLMQREPMLEIRELRIEN